VRVAGSFAGHDHQGQLVGWVKTHPTIPKKSPRGGRMKIAQRFIAATNEWNDFSSPWSGRLKTITTRFIAKSFLSPVSRALDLP